MLDTSDDITALAGIELDLSDEQARLAGGKIVFYKKPKVERPRYDISADALTSPDTVVTHDSTASRSDASADASVDASADTNLTNIQSQKRARLRTAESRLTSAPPTRVNELRAQPSKKISAVYTGATVTSLPIRARSRLHTRMLSKSADGAIEQTERAALARQGKCLTARGVRCVGALRSPEDPNDFIFERIAKSPLTDIANSPMARGRGHADDKHKPRHITPRALPEEFSLAQFAAGVRDQGARGTCAAFAGAGIKEIQERQDCGFRGYMSPEFIYYHRENKPLDGMYGRSVFKVLQQIGSVPETLYPYADAPSNTPPGRELYDIAARYRIANYARVVTVDGLKRALVELGPCYVQLPLYTSSAQFWRRPTDWPADEPSAGGHAVIAVGYDRAGFWLKNSWGDWWGRGGYCLWPYEDWTLHWECWVSVDARTPTARALNNKLEEIRTARRVERTRSKDESCDHAHVNDHARVNVHIRARVDHSDTDASAHVHDGDSVNAGTDSPATHSIESLDAPRADRVHACGPDCSCGNAVQITITNKRRHGKCDIL